MVSQPQQGQTPRPRVSIIMPAHNAARHLPAAIASIQAQTMSDWELWVVDDASTDETPALLAELSAADPRIHVLRAGRLGTPSKARNVGLQQANGDYIAFLDADDLYVPETLARLLGGFRQHPGATAVYGFPAYMDADGQPLTQGVQLLPDPETDGYRIPPTYDHSWQFILEGMISCMLPGLMLPRATLDRVGLLNEQLLAAEDYEFYLRLFLDNHDGVVALPTYIYQYRVHASSLTKTPAHMARILDNVLSIIDWVFAQPALPDEAHVWQPTARAHVYRYLSRERILNCQPGLARRMLWRALRDPGLPTRTWCRLCLPLVLRSVLPTALNHQLVQARWQCRRLLERATWPSGPRHPHPASLH